MTGTAPRIVRGRSAASAVALIALAVGLSACQTTSSEVTTSIPSDYRLRHPTTIQEGDRKLVLFIGERRGTLTATQRAEVLAFTQSWRHDATGGMIIDVPTGTPNQRAAHEAVHEVQSLIAAAEVPSSSVVVRPYQPTDPLKFAPLKLSYPKITATVGPCGLWPHDIGPDHDPEYLENREYFNLGCAQQRNLAAMVANPSDLVQPRAETPVYEARRSQALDKYRKGESPATNYPNASQGKISDLGND